MTQQELNTYIVEELNRLAILNHIADSPGYIYDKDIQSISIADNLQNGVYVSSSGNEIAITLGNIIIDGTRNMETRKPERIRFISVDEWNELNQEEQREYILDNFGYIYNEYLLLTNGKEHDQEFVINNEQRKWYTLELKEDPYMTLQEEHEMVLNNVEILYKQIMVDYETVTDKEYNIGKTNLWEKTKNSKGQEIDLYQSQSADTKMKSLALQAELIRLSWLQERNRNLIKRVEEVKDEKGREIGKDFLRLAEIVKTEEKFRENTADKIPEETVRNKNWLYNMVVPMVAYAQVFGEKTKESVKTFINKIETKYRESDDSIYEKLDEVKEDFQEFIIKTKEVIRDSTINVRNAMDSVSKTANKWLQAHKEAQIERENTSYEKQKQKIQENMEKIAIEHENLTKKWELAKSGILELKSQIKEEEKTKLGEIKKEREENDKQYSNKIKELTETYQPVINWYNKKAALLNENTDKINQFNKQVMTAYKNAIKDAEDNLQKFKVEEEKKFEQEKERKIKEEYAKRLTKEFEDWKMSYTKTIDDKLIKYVQVCNEENLKSFVKKHTPEYAQELEKKYNVKFSEQGYKDVEKLLRNFSDKSFELNAEQEKERKSIEAQRDEEIARKEEELKARIEGAIDKAALKDIMKTINKDVKKIADEHLQKLIETEKETKEEIKFLKESMQLEANHFENKWQKTENSITRHSAMEDKYQQEHDEVKSKIDELYNKNNDVFKKEENKIIEKLRADYLECAKTVCKEKGIQYNEKLFSNDYFKDAIDNVIKEPKEELEKAMEKARKELENLEHKHQTRIEKFNREK